MQLRPSARGIALMMLFSTGAAASWASCCSLSREALDDMIGRHNECPSSSRIGDRLEKKCASCPEGTCRVVDTCYCPKDFLESYDDEKDDADPSPNSPPGKCAGTHGGKRWPESIEAGDVTWRGCGEDVTLTDFGSKSCCLLTEEELKAASGTSEYCPTRYGYSIKDLEEKCKTCPAGTCRVDLECYCPHDFLEHYKDERSSSGWADCETSFTAKWPDSLGKEDKDWRSCEKIEPTSIQVTNHSNPAGAKPAPGGPGDDSSSGTRGNDEGQGAKEDESERGINWEKWGGIWGGVGVVATIIFGVVGVWFSRRRPDQN